jgi:Tfp pilus assembly protein PilW
MKMRDLARRARQHGATLIKLWIGLLLVFIVFLALTLLISLDRAV